MQFHQQMSCPAATAAYYAQLSERIRRMTLGDMRAVMALLHEAQLKRPLPQLEHLLLPHVGCTVGEFSTAYVMNMPPRKKGL